MDHNKNSQGRKRGTHTLGDTMRFKTHYAREECISILSLENVKDIFKYDYYPSESRIVFKSIKRFHSPTFPITYTITIEDSSPTIITIKLATKGILGLSAGRYEVEILKFMSLKLDAVKI